MTTEPNDEPLIAQPRPEFSTEVPSENFVVDDLQVTPLAAEVTAEPARTAPPEVAVASEDVPLFASFSQPEPPPQVRIPHLGHLGLVAVFLVFAAFIVGVLAFAANRLHLLGVAKSQAATIDVRLALGGELAVYLLTFLAAYFTLPLIWQMGFFKGLEWNGTAAMRYSRRLAGVGFVCFVIAILNILFIPGPTNAPIEKIFKQPGAAWLLFAFGVTAAPFFEEMLFRGFLLPALATAFDWLAENLYHVPRRPLTPDGHPRWSLSAMIIASLVTSVPFAAMHAEQTGNSVDAVLLLGCISMVLCGVRLVTRSLAASVMVHSIYNFLLFSMMLVGSQGFQHLDKM